MDQRGVRGRIAEIIERSVEVPREAVLADTPFAELGCDSLDVVEISIAIERELDIDLEGRVNARNMPRNLTDVVRVLETVGVK